MKRFAKVLSLLLAFAIFSSTASFAASVPTSQEKMTDICLVSTEDYFVVVSVPESKAVAYQERLESDREFFQTQLQEATRSSEYPGYPGRVVFEKYMYKEDIKKEVDAAAGAGAFYRFLSGISGAITSDHIRKLLHLAKVPNIYKFIANVLLSSIIEAQQQREDWFNQALIDILENKIRALKYVIIENVTEYPKIWRIYIRV